MAGGNPALGGVFVPPNQEELLRRLQSTNTYQALAGLGNALATPGRVWSGEIPADQITDAGISMGYNLGTAGLPGALMTRPAAGVLHAIAGIPAGAEEYYLKGLANPDHFLNNPGMVNPLKPAADIVDQGIADAVKGLAQPQTDFWGGLAAKGYNVEDVKTDFGGEESAVKKAMANYPDMFNAGYKAGLPANKTATKAMPDTALPDEFYGLLDQLAAKGYNPEKIEQEVHGFTGLTPKGKIAELNYLLNDPEGQTLAEKYYKADAPDTFFGPTPKPTTAGPTGHPELDAKLQELSVLSGYPPEFEASYLPTPYNTKDPTHPAVLQKNLDFLDNFINTFKKNKVATTVQPYAPPLTRYSDEFDMIMRQLHASGRDPNEVNLALRNPYSEEGKAKAQELRGLLPENWRDYLDAEAMRPPASPSVPYRSVDPDYGGISVNPDLPGTFQGGPKELAGAKEMGYIPPLEVQQAMGVPNPNADLPPMFYHGSNAQYRTFRKPEEFNRVEPGMFFADQPNISATYGQQIYPVHLRMENPLIRELNKTHYDSQEMDQLIRDAMAGGHDSVVAKNMYDAGGLQNQYIVFDPSQIRSTWAKFDPAKRDSRDILAALLGGGLPMPWIWPEDRQ